MKMKRLFVILFVVILSTFIFADGHVKQFESKMVEDLIYSNYMETELGMDIYWEFSEDNDLYMVIKAPVSGWISIGFEPSNRMKDAKIIIIGLNNDEVVLEEHYGNSMISHRKIEEKYIENFYGERTEEYSLAEIKIPLNEESRYNTLKPDAKIKTIIAYHNSSDSFMRRHSQRDTIEIQF
ncbi:MAG: DOMON domain-containing protein [Thermotogota bacterium]